MSLPVLNYLTTGTHLSLFSFTQLSSSLLSHPTVFLAPHLSTQPPISLLSHPSIFLLGYPSLYYTTHLSTVLSHLSLDLGPFLFSTQTEISLTLSTCLSSQPPNSLLSHQSISIRLLIHPSIFLATYLSTQPTSSSIFVLQN